MMWIETGRSCRCVAGEYRATVQRNRDDACVWMVSRVSDAVARIVATGGEDDIDGARRAVELEMARLNAGGIGA